MLSCWDENADVFVSAPGPKDSSFTIFAKVLIILDHCVPSKENDFLVN